MIKVLGEIPDWLSRPTGYQEMYGNQEAKVSVQRIEKLYEAMFAFLRHCLRFNAQISTATPSVNPRTLIHCIPLPI